MFFVRPVLLLSLSVIVGVSLAFIGAPWYALVPVVLVLSVLRVSHSPGHVILASALIIVGFLRGSVVSTPSVVPGPLSTVVQAVNSPIFTESGYYRGKVRDVASSEEFLMYWSEPWAAGLRLEVQGEVVIPIPPLNPGELDYAAYLDRQGIQGLFFVRTARPVARFRASLIESLRGFLRANLDDLPDASKGLALAAMLGDRSGLSTSVQENWRKSGASHILAVSGMHISIAAGAVYSLARRFTGFRTSWVVAGLSALLYTSLVGSSASAWRAALAFILLAVAKIALREAEPLNILGLVAALMLLLSPQALEDAGFLLSFAATLGLVWISPSLKSILPGHAYLRSLLSATLAAQAATLPVVLSLFGTWPFYGLLSNLLLVPASTLLVGSSLLAGMLGRVPGIRVVVYAVFSGVAWFFSSVVGWIASLPIASVNLVAMPVILIVAYYALLAFFPRVIKGYARLGAVVTLCFMIMTAMLPSLIQSRDIELTFLSIGNADACHVRIGRQHYLIDVGTQEAAERIIVPYLRSQGVNALAGVFISHGHDDHVGGLPTLEQEFGIKWVFAGPGVELGERYTSLADSMHFAIGPTTLTAWQAQGSDLDLNNQSVVLLLQHGRFSALFTGDIGHVAEQALLPTITPVNVLKVAHHGSGLSSSSRWVQATYPRIAIISVGPNSYGHPSAVVTKALTDIGCQVLRTDETGAVRVVTKGNRYEVLTYAKGRWQRVRTYALSATNPGSKVKSSAPHLPFSWGRGMVCAAGCAAS